MPEPSIKTSVEAMSVAVLKTTAPKQRAWRMRRISGPHERYRRRPDGCSRSTPWKDLFLLEVLRDHFHFRAHAISFVFCNFRNAPFLVNHRVQTMKGTMSLPRFEVVNRSSGMSFMNRARYGSGIRCTNAYITPFDIDGRTASTSLRCSGMIYFVRYMF